MCTAGGFEAVERELKRTQLNLNFRAEHKKNEKTKYEN